MTAGTPQGGVQSGGGAACGSEKRWRKRAGGLA
jgi:hypothetical protein